jgi:nucleotidyltransferase substrate binding protein (TIGR01987 family)
LPNLSCPSTFTKKAKQDGFYYAGISKSFEICLEYAWKYLKRCAINEGLEVYSPKDAIKAAGQLKIIDNVEKWLEFIEDRNLAVHDYLGISQDEYLKTIKGFLSEAQKIIS